MEFSFLYYVNLTTLNTNQNHCHGGKKSIVREGHKLFGQNIFEGEVIAYHVPISHQLFIKNKSGSPASKNFNIVFGNKKRLYA